MSTSKKSDPDLIHAWAGYRLASGKTIAFPESVLESLIAPFGRIRPRADNQETSENMTGDQGDLR